MSESAFRRLGARPDETGSGVGRVECTGQPVRPLGRRPWLLVALLAWVPGAARSQPRPEAAGQRVEPQPREAALDAGAPPAATAPAEDRSTATIADGRLPARAAEPAPAAPLAREPWRAFEAVHAPQWLRFGLSHRARFEHLENDFRASTPGSVSALSLRTLVTGELRFAPVVVSAELQDSRAFATTSAPLTTSLINPLELLQATVGLRAQGLFIAGDEASLTLGRQTLDVGSRRLVARNEYRNTINGFTGLDAQWASPARHVLRAFAVLPVVRAPSTIEGLAVNAIEFDRENTDALLWGAFYGAAPWRSRVQLQPLLLGLHERDSARVETANRSLITPALRVLRPPAPGALDFQLELMGQVGSSRATAAIADTTDLWHRAASVHASAGFLFDVAWRPRVALQFDGATGDADPGDTVNGRFDPLFGARRFDFGPTGLFGALARSNLNAPGLRLECAPQQTLDVLAEARLVWLASARDAWTTAGLRDPWGASGTFVGEQLEARVRWTPFPRNLVFEVGGAAFLRGAFALNAPGGRAAPTLYLMTQVTGTL